MDNNIIRMDSIFKRREKKVFTIPAGKTIGEIINLPEVTKDFPKNSDISVAINGNIVPIEQWRSRKLREGEYLFFMPKVAGGDNDGKTILNVVIMIALIYFAPQAGTWLAGGEAAVQAGGTAAFMAGVYTTAIVVGGGMIISSLQPHPKKPSSGFIDSEESQSFGWNPTTLQRQGITIPRMYGKNKVFGNVVSVYTEKEAITYTQSTITEVFYYQNRNNPRWWEKGYKTTTVTTEFDPRKVNLYAQICESIGPIREPVIAGTMKLNDQPIENLTGIYWEDRNGLLRQNPIGFFEDTILEVFVGRIVKNGTPITYTTSNANFHNIEVEISFPQGLYDGSGVDLANNTVNITVEIKKSTTSVWVILADGVNITEAVGDKVIRTYTTDGIISVDFGSNYDVRVTKNTGERDNIRYGDDLYLDKVREITEIQFSHPRRALVGVKALATEQLSGSIRWSAYARGLYVVDYNDSANSVKYSNNPALVIADILTQPVYSGSYSPWLDMNLFLNFEGVDAATSTIDDSIKDHSITFGGNAQIDTAQFRFGSSSGLVDGVGDYFQIVNDRNLFGLFDSLMEDWTFDIYLRMGDHDGTEVIVGQYVDANNYWYLRHVGGAGLALYLYVGGSALINISGVGEISDTDWHHLAICKNKKEVGLYKDNTQIGYALMAAVDGYVFEGSDLYLGQDGNSASYLFGHYDHVRLMNRNYFEAVPVSGLTDTITKPSVLFTNPGNSFVIERYDGYNPSKLLVADIEELYDWCAAAQINSKNFTILNITQAVNAVITTTSKHPFAIGDVILFRNVNDNGMTEITDGTTANVIKITNDTTFTIDLDTSGYTTYEIVDKLLYHFDGLDGDTEAIDSSPTVYNLVAGNFDDDAQIDTAQQKWGVSSLYIDGTNDGIKMTLWSNFQPFANLTDNWTYDFWVRHIDHVDDEVYVAGPRTIPNDIWYLYHQHGSGIRILQKVGGVNKVDTGFVGEISDTDWHHIAFIKVGDKIGLYKDGTQIGYDLMVVGDIDTNSCFLNLGYQWITQTFELNGHIDEFRLTKSNPFGAAPVVGLTDLITKPTGAHTAAADAGTVEEYQPRFTINGIFDTDKTMWEAVLEVCELCRCVPFWSGDKIRFAIDKSKISSYAFTMGNILTNTYKELYIPQKDRASEVEVHFRDEEKDFDRTPYTLMNPDSGRIVNKVRLDMFGITQSDMSQRLANHKLKQLQYIKKMGFWSTDVEGIPCEIGDKVDVQNDASNYGQIGSGDDKYTGGGRIIAASELSNGHTLVTIDGEIAFSDADWDGGSTEYKMLVKGKTDAPPESRQIIGIETSVVDDGTYDITITGTYAVTPVVDDVWAAGISEFETIPYVLTDLKQSSRQRVDCVGVHYVEEIYEDD